MTGTTVDFRPAMTSASRMLNPLARWFEPVYPSQDYQGAHYLILGLILAVGAGLRFWALGYAGLHGDEDIMGLAAKGVLEHGIPLMPGEMLYTRAPLHTYMIAGSMWLFGQTEWAMRFPSALVGSCFGLLAFFMGKRFLEPGPNLVFCALMTFLPAMIDIAQTARMYVFFVACLMVYAALLFRWEVTGRIRFLLLAGLAWLLALQFHALSIFAALLFLFPGLSSQSWRKVLHGGLALLGALLAFRAFQAASHRVGRNFRADWERIPAPPDVDPVPLELVAQGPSLLIIALAVIAIAGVVIFGLRAAKREPAVVFACVLLALGVAACAALHYHVGAILLLFGAIAWLRTRPGSYRELVLLAAAVAVMALVQLVILYGSGEFQGRQFIGAMVGTPSIWPPLRFAEASPVGVAMYALILGFAAWKLARGERLPVHFLFFALACWAPLFAIGIFRWDVPLRYMHGILPFFMLCLVAGVAYLYQESDIRPRLKSRPLVPAALALVMVISFVNPIAMGRIASNDYRTHPDHKGAAEFILSLQPGPNDILIAEDSINQTFYLGKVDYRLLSVDVARTHSILVDGVLRGQYTGTPIMGTGEELQAMLDQNDNHGQIYVIGSGEEFLQGRRERPRGRGIYEVLESDKLEVIYEGRDNRTKVWRRR
jgi:hypothetical protein